MTVFCETDRLRLREFAPADAPLLFALDSDPEVRRYVHLSPPDSLDPYHDRIARCLRYYADTPGYGYWAAEERAGGAFLGWFHLRPALDARFAAESDYRPGDMELGYRLTRAIWGRGYATEGSRLLVARGLADPAVGRVVASALLPNRASVRVLEKAGLTWRATVTLPGIELPAVVYAADRPEV